MPYKKENLEKLLVLIKQICDEKDNDWFKEKLIGQLIINSPENKNETSNGFESYFKLLKKQFRIKANKFYENITDKQLKAQLVNDCVQMYWYQVNNDVNQLFVYAFFQMENMLNYYATHSNCYEKIKSNKNYYTHVFNENFIVSCKSSFLDSEDNHKPIIKINIWGKLIFWAYDTNNIEYLKNQNNNFSNLINIRNSFIHKMTQEHKMENYSLDYVRYNDFSGFGFYTNILKEIMKTLTKISTDVKKREFKETKIELPGLNVKGKIDVDSFKKR
jgi:hypothetical protein